jgi:hypothetical protein
MMKLKVLLLAALFLGPRALSAQEVELEPGERVTIVAKDSVAVVVDTIVRIDTLVVTDTVVRIDTVAVVDTVYACPPGWTCEESVLEPPTPLAGFYIAGYALPDPFDATENGLHVAWALADADSIWVYGSKQDGTDEWDRVVPGTDTVYRHRLFYTEVTPMEACGVPIRDGLLGDEVCDSMDWPPMVRAGEPPSVAPGRPEFTALSGGRVAVIWDPAEGATEYRYWYTGHSEAEALTTPTHSVTVSDFANGGYFCARGANAAGPAPNPNYRCNSYRP